VGPASVSVEQRPAFYALKAGGWRDYVTLLHPPYTLWHLSYVAIGAALAPTLPVERLLWGLAAFFLALGVGAHALDELNGRPLRTAIPDQILVTLAAASIGVAATIGLAAALAWTPLLVPFVVFGTFIVVAYNLELFGGRFHSDLWFALAWGAFPVLTAYVGAAETIHAEALLAAAFAAFLSLAQRHLSTQVRTIRRRTDRVAGSISFAEGHEEQITRDSMLRAPEAALHALTWAIVALALTMLALHVR
jgi:hypothetical protein